MSDSQAACPFCIDAQAVALWPGAGVDGFTVARCGRCGLAFTQPRLTDDELAPYYAENYYGQRHRVFLPFIERLMRRWRGKRAARIAQLHAPGRALDIGCGRGWTLSALRDLGWQVQGVERSGESAAFAQDELRLPLAVGPFEPARFDNASFDAVILWHVLEHLHNLPEALDGAARLVKPGGLLVIAVPNIASWQAAITRYGWFHLDMPRHYWHFSRDWLAAALAERGFRLAAERHFSAEQNPYGWLQGLLNRFGLRRNLLYDLLRRDQARRTAQPWRDYPFQSAVSVAALLALGPLCVLLAALEAAVGRGGTMDFYAVREAAPTAEAC